MFRGDGYARACAGGDGAGFQTVTILGLTLWPFCTAFSGCSAPVQCWERGVLHNATRRQRAASPRRETLSGGRPMAGCDLQAVPGGRAVRRASAARPSHRLLEDPLCTRTANRTGATRAESSRQRLKEKECRPSRRPRASDAQSDFPPRGSGQPKLTPSKASPCPCPCLSSQSIMRLCGTDHFTGLPRGTPA